MQWIKVQAFGAVSGTFETRLAFEASLTTIVTMIMLLLQFGWLHPGVLSILLIFLLQKQLWWQHDDMVCKSSHARNVFVSSF